MIKLDDIDSIYVKIINDEYPDEVYGEVALYDPTEDWMELQLDYGVFGNGRLKMYCIGGIILRQITPTNMQVYIKDMDAEGTEHFLFSWSKDQDITPYQSDGDYEMSAEFAWNLCHKVNKF